MTVSLRPGLPFVLSALLAAQASADDLIAVYEQSLGLDPRFIAAQLEYEAAQEAIPQARSQLLPALDLSAEYLETDQDIRSSDNEVFATGKTSFPTNSYGLTLSQPIFRWSEWQRLKQSHAEVAQAFAVLAEAEQDLMYRVASAYLGVLAAQDNLDFVQAEREAVERQRELAIARRTSGLATRTDEFDANARYALVLADEIEAQNQLDDSRQALAESIGGLVPTLDLLGETIPLVSPEPMDVDAWVDLATEQNLAVEARRQAVAIAEKEVDRHQASRLPTLDLVARLDDRDTGGSLFGGGSEVETADLLIQLNVPLYQGGGPRSRVREATTRLSQAREELKLELLVVGRETRGAFLGVMSGISKVDAYQASLVAQANALEAKRRGYESGLNTALDVLDAERDRYLIMRDYAQARYDYLLDTLQLKRATGTLSVADLAAINGMLATEAVQ
jgi:outer membrane protein